MKKLIFAFVALSAVAFASETAPNEMLKAWSIMGSCLALGLAGLGAAIGMGNTAAATISGTARNPSVGSKLTTTMFIALAMIEAQVIYALVIVLISLYANPLLG